MIKQINKDTVLFDASARLSWQPIYDLLRNTRNYYANRHKPMIELYWPYRNTIEEGYFALSRKWWSHHREFFIKTILKSKMSSFKKPRYTDVIIKIAEAFNDKDFVKQVTTRQFVEKREENLYIEHILNIHTPLLLQTLRQHKLPMVAEYCSHHITPKMFQDYYVDYLVKHLELKKNEAKGSANSPSKTSLGRFIKVAGDFFKEERILNKWKEYNF